MRLKVSGFGAEGLGGVEVEYGRIWGSNDSRIYGNRIDSIQVTVAEGLARQKPCRKLGKMRNSGYRSQTAGCVV